jgi:hypothetical protein
VKKTGSILILSLYLLLSVGIAKSTHFCMGRAHHSSLFSFESKKCACSIYKSAKVKTCCEDETEIETPQTDWSLLPAVTFEWKSSEIVSRSLTQVVSYDLPPPKVPIYQLGCSWKVDGLMA